MVFLYILIGLVVVFALLAIFAPKKINVEREMIIKKPVNEVFAMLLKLKEQNKWSVWAKMDPNMKVTFTGVDGTVGFVSAWEGNKQVGKGFQEIKSFVSNERIDIRLKFEKPWESDSQSYYITESVNGDTLVKWGLITTMPIPMNLFSLFMNMDKVLGKDLIGGLTNFKEIMENHEK
jgi:hypothetical protein